MTRTKAVLYHRNCPDGFGAAFAAWLKLQETAVYIAVNYNEDFPRLSEDIRELYIVDFSYPAEVLEGLVGQFDKIVILDHHKTAQEALGGLIGKHPNLEIIFDMHQSGAVLSYRYFNGLNREDSIPEIFEYIQDRDLWTWKLPDSKEINAAISSYPLDFKVWNRIYFKMDMDLVAEGRAILRAQQQEIDRILKSAYFAEILNVKVPVVNSQTHVSEVGNQLALKYPDAPFVGVYFDTEHGHRKWSLRSVGKDPKNDVSAIAKKFGGGGHFNAASFNERRESGGPRAVSVEPPVERPKCVVCEQDPVFVEGTKGKGADYEVVLSDICWDCAR